MDDTLDDPQGLDGTQRAIGDWDPQLAAQVLAYQYRQGRRDLPWQQTRTPYRVWVSEIMLQQTQVATVTGYFNRFMDTFPQVGALAQAPVDRVMQYWAGLGYYARARYMHQAAQQVVQAGHGDLPLDYDQLVALPGIGRSTAGAILSLAGNLPYPILDANVRRVLGRYFAITDPPVGKGLVRYWAIAQAHVPADEPGWYNQGLMDLGALVCVPRAPRCTVCPLQTGCQAYAQQAVLAYPRAVPRVVVQEQVCHWLWLQAPDALCLVRRPLSGIWAGLHGLPEVTWEVAQTWIPRRQQVAVTHCAPFTHALTHRKLVIHVTVCHVNAPIRVPVAGAAWFTPADHAALGKPAPLARLLASVGGSFPLPQRHAKGVSRRTRAELNRKEKLTV